MKNIVVVFSITLVLLSLITSSAHALGIGPGRIELDFEPGMSRTLEYLVLNNERKAVDVDIYVGGELAKYVTCSTDLIRFTPYETTKTFTCDLNLPQSIDKHGLLDTRIGVVESMESTDSGGAMVGGRVGVESQLWITVPYPGYYADVRLTAPDTASGSDVIFTISIDNKGTNSFTASGTIKIFEGDILLATLDAGQLALGPTQDGTLTITWPTEGRGAGQYRAVATVEYDGNVKEVEAIFRIGELRAEITDVLNVKTPAGSIAKFSVKAESVWNEPISDMYITVNVLGSGGNALVSGTSETFSMKGWEKKEVFVYVDTNDLDPGTYDVRAILHYLDVTSVKDVPGGLEVTAFTIDTPTALALIIIVLLIIAVFVYIKRRKVRRK